MGDESCSDFDGGGAGGCFEWHAHRYQPRTVLPMRDGRSGRGRKWNGHRVSLFQYAGIDPPAFERNAPNKGVSSVHMHSDIEGTVMDFIADHDLLSGSYDTITEFLLAYTPSTNFPKLVSKLSTLEHLHLDHTAIGPVKAGSLSLPSPKTLKLMTISYSPLY